MTTVLDYAGTHVGTPPVAKTAPRRAPVLRTVKAWLREPDRRVWTIWLGVLWILAGGMVFQGIALITHYSAVAPSSRAYAAFVKLPGGLTTFGCVQLVLGVSLIGGIAAPIYGARVKVKYVLTMIVANGVYCGVTAMAFLAAPIAGGLRNTGWIVWSIPFLIFGLMLLLPPTTKQPHPVRRGESP